MSETSERLTAVELARKFHETYERLAPDYGYQTRDDTKQFDPHTANGRLMVAVCEVIKADHIDAIGAELSRVSFCFAINKSTTDSLILENKKLEAENARLREEIAGFPNLSSMRQAMIDTATENARLAEVAKTIASYAIKSHKRGCEYFTSGNCTCGLRTALAEIKQGEKR